MDRIEREKCLQSMIILCDTREQPSARATKRYNSFGCPYRRQTLNYGDYTYSFTLPDGRELIPEGVTASGVAVIERKMDLTELSGCFTHDRARFEAEFKRANENNATVYLLVEDASWENLMNGKYRTRFNAKSYLASILAWTVRFDLKPIFCKSETSGKLIKEILYRELKERLERGDYG